MNLPFAEITATQGVFLAGLGLAIFILLSRSRRYFRGKATSLTKTPGRLSAAGAAQKPPAHWHDAPDEMRRWQIEMHELARDYSARIDTKIAALQALLIDADQVAARLESLLDQADRQARPTAHSTPQTSTSRRETLPSPETIQQRLDDKRIDARLEYICALADEGLSAKDIATRLNRAVGDIELLLSVRPPRAAS